MKIDCPRCGSNVKFKPSTQKCYCEHCGSDIEITEFNIDNFEKEDECKYDEYICSTCGAKLIMDKNTTITECIYCGSIQIIKQRFKGIFKPEAIIPFKIEKDDFIKSYKKMIKWKVFAPNEFKRNAKITEVKGIYVPFYLYSCDASIYARGMGVNMREKDNAYYKFFEIAYEEKMEISQDAGLNFDDDIMTSLEPFYFNELKKFNPVYLNGFLSEKGDLSLEDIDKCVNRRIKNEVQKEISRRISPHNHEGGKLNIKLKNLEKKYVLIPVWFFCAEYKGKKYSYALNAQTGKVVGQIPISLFRLMLWVAFMIAWPIFELPIPGELWVITWILGFVVINARYYNVKKVLQNPIGVSDIKEILDKGYIQNDYDEVFGKEDYSGLDIEVINE